MDDRQPPKKKSRFFSEGKVLLNNLLHRNGSKSKTSDDDKRADGDVQHSQPMFNVDIARTQATTDTDEEKPTRITPTAAAFQDLSVQDRDNRRQAIYGKESLESAIGGKPKQYQSAATTSQSSAVPWLSAVQQHEARQGSSSEPISRLESQFTFRAPAPQPELLYPQAATKAAIQQTPTSKSSNTIRDPSAVPFNPRLIRTPILSPLKVRKQRVELPPIPQSPDVVASGSGPPRLRSKTTAVDVDRDVRGHPLPSQSTSTGFTNLPLHATATPVHTKATRPKVPENALTSPGRLKRAITFASRKRKRGDAEMLPPAYVYTRTNDPNFNVFRGILLYPELCFHLASHLPVEDLISLYAISRDYHTILDTRFTTVILVQALKKAPESSRVFPFRSFAQLCRKDPAARIPHPDPTKAAAGVIRLIPSFRWLKMIIYREKTVHAIMALFAERGIPLPRRCGIVIKKLWFMLDIPDNARRIGFIHNPQMINDLDLYFAACFLVKLDMLFTDPVATSKRVEGRRLILSQQSFTKLLQLLKGEAFSTRWQLMQAWVEWRYDPAHETIDDELMGDEETMFGIPKADWGRLKREYWGRRQGPDGNLIPKAQLPLLLRPDQLIVREAIRRGMSFAGHYIRFLLYGYVHPKTMDDFQPREITRQIGEYNEDDYTVDDMVVGTQAMTIEDGGDPLLDLGRKFKAGKSIARPQVTQAEREYKAEEDAFLNELYAEHERERRDRDLQ